MSEHKKCPPIGTVKLHHLEDDLLQTIVGRIGTDRAVQLGLVNRRFKEVIEAKTNRSRQRFFCETASRALQLPCKRGGHCLGKTSHVFGRPHGRHHDHHGHHQRHMVVAEESTMLSTTLTKSKGQQQQQQLLPPSLPQQHLWQMGDNDVAAWASQFTRGSLSKIDAIDWSGNTTLSPRSIQALHSVPLQHLRVLRLSFCAKISDTSVEALLVRLAQHNRLTTLDLSGCTQLTSRCIANQRIVLRSLTDVSTNGSSIPSLAVLSCLERGLTDVPDAVAGDVRGGGSSSNCSSKGDDRQEGEHEEGKQPALLVRCLRINRLVSGNEVSKLKTLAKSMPSLREFECGAYDTRDHVPWWMLLHSASLVDFSNACTSDALRSLTTHCTRLEKLAVSFAPAVTAWTLPGAGDGDTDDRGGSSSSSSRLRVLSLTGCTRFDVPHAPSAHPLSVRSGLVRLDLLGTRHLTDAALEHIQTACRDTLEELSFSARRHMLCAERLAYFTLRACAKLRRMTWHMAPSPPHATPPSSPESSLRLHPPPPPPPPHVAWVTSMSKLAATAPAKTSPLEVIEFVDHTCSSSSSSSSSSRSNDGRDSSDNNNDSETQKSSVWGMLAALCDKLSRVRFHGCSRRVSDEASKALGPSRCSVWPSP